MDASQTETETASDFSMSDVPIENADVGSSLPSAEEVRTSMAVEGSSASGSGRRIGRGGSRRSAGAEGDADDVDGERVVSDVVDDDDDFNNRGGGDDSMFLTTMACSVLTLIVLVIGLSVGLTAANDDDSSSSTVARRSDYASVVNYLVGEAVSSIEDFNTAESPQQLAAIWLAEDDKRNLAVPSVPITQDEGYDFLTRYVLALDYIALGGENWRYNFNFLSGHDICDWTGYALRNGRIIQEGVICNKNRKIIGLDLDSKNLKGTLPRENGLLSSLRLLDFGWNVNLYGEFYDEFCWWTRMEQLALGYTSLSGTIPPCIGSFSNLRVLFLSNTFLEGEVPEEMKNLEQLRLLYLDDGLDLFGNVTDMFDGMTELIGLFLEDNDFTGTIDRDFLGNHERLRQVDLSSNELSGGDFGHMLDYPELQVLDLHGNDFSAVLPQVIANNTAMLFMALHDNDFEGPVPPAFKNLTRLIHLDLSNNGLEGTMPTELGELTDLEYLFLGRNFFSEGTIPAEYSELTGLSDLSLKETNRNGTLPEFIALMQNLTFLDLDNNKINSNIPSVYGELSELQFLLLSRNKLSGKVPGEFEALTDLRAVFLEVNDLTGNLDMLCKLATFNEAKNDADGEEIISADCKGDPPQINCTCCKLCCEADDVECHDNYMVASLDPIWERGYQRYDFEFGNESDGSTDNLTDRYISRDFIPGEKRNLRSSGPN